jgi:cell division transport system ATP-binding protein
VNEKTASLIELVNVTSGFKGRKVLSGASLTVAKGDLVVIEGATGAGKTTLVRVILGAQPVQAGLAHVLETDLTKPGPAGLMILRRRIGVVFQIPRFVEQESVLSNVSVPLAIAGQHPRRCRTEGTNALLDANLLSSAHKRPSQLSGGEQARLQIARALIHNPYLVLADEPFAHLDPDSAAEAEALLAAAHARGTTVVITTHRPTSLTEHARRWRLEDGKLT